MKESFWSKGAFFETMSQEEMKEKEKTIHKRHDEDMNYNCKECNKKISAHNKDWHGNMCDDCFNKMYFPEDAQIMDTDLESIKRHCLSSSIRKDNASFLKLLQETDQDLSIIDKIVKEVESKISCSGSCCSFLHPSFRKENSEQLIKNAQICPIVFNVLENAKLEFEQEIYEFENPEV